MAEEHTRNNTTTLILKPIHIGILVYDEFEPLDVWGFTQAFAISRHLGTPYNNLKNPPFKVSFIANCDRKNKDEIPPTVKSYNGPRVAPDYFRNDVTDVHFKDGIDVLMIPGGHGSNLILHSIDTTHGGDPAKPSQELTALLDWIKIMDDKVSHLTSVCTGAAILSATGLLDGKAATSNHQAFMWVASFGKNVLWNNVSRWVDAGKYCTSAGVSAGTDMAFYLVEKLAGRAVAEAAATASEYDWHRDPEKPIYYPQQASLAIGGF